MAQPLYNSGIDLHKRKSVICTVDSNGNRVKEATINSHPKALTAYFATLPGDHRAVVEATSGWYWVSDLCAGIGVDLKLAHAGRLKAISQAKVKTDRVDAATLAQLLRVDLIPEAFAMPPATRELRDILRGRLRLIQSRTRCKNTITSMLEQYNTERVRDLPELYQLQIEAQRKQIDLLNHQKTFFEKSLRPRLHRDLRLYRLACLPGVGEIVASTILLETGDINRFPSDRQYFSYARLVPGAANSGMRQRHRSGHKAGNAYLKLAFSHAAVRAIQYNPEIRVLYGKKRRRKHPKVARAFIAKELARMAYHVLKTNTDFDGCFKGTPLKRRKTPRWPRPASPALGLADQVSA